MDYLEKISQLVEYLEGTPASLSVWVPDGSAANLTGKVGKRISFLKDFFRFSFTNGTKTGKLFQISFIKTSVRFIVYFGWVNLRSPKVKTAYCSLI